MPVRTSTATWHGSLEEGDGSFALGSGACEGPYSFPSRFEEGPGSNPEELIGAALASCYSMFLSNLLATAGNVPTRVHTEAHVHLGHDDNGQAVTKIALVCRAEVAGMADELFAEHARAAKAGCPISKALAAVPVELDASLA